MRSTNKKARRRTTGKVEQHCLFMSRLFFFLRERCFFSLFFFGSYMPLKGESFTFMNQHKRHTRAFWILLPSFTEETFPRGRQQNVNKSTCVSGSQPVVYHTPCNVGGDFNRPLRPGGKLSERFSTSGRLRFLANAGVQNGGFSASPDQNVGVCRACFCGSHD